MHDLHLADKILHQIIEFAKKNNLSRIEKVWVEIGPIVEHGQEIEPENLIFNLIMLAKGTPAERAELDVKKISRPGEYIIKEIEGE